MKKKRKENKITLYKPRLVSIGQLWITLSTISGMGVKKSDDAISGLKIISGPKKRSNPTSTSYDYY